MPHAPQNLPAFSSVRFSRSLKASTHACQSSSRTYPSRLMSSYAASRQRLRAFLRFAASSPAAPRNCSFSVSSRRVFRVNVLGPRLHASASNRSGSSWRRACSAPRRSSFFHRFFARSHDLSFRVSPSQISPARVRGAAYKAAALSPVPNLSVLKCVCRGPLPLYSSLAYSQISKRAISIETEVGGVGVCVCVCEGGRAILSLKTGGRC